MPGIILSRSDNDKIEFSCLFSYRILVPLILSGQTVNLDWRSSATQNIFDSFWHLSKNTLFDILLQEKTAEVAELADAMDSKSIVQNSQVPENNIGYEFCQNHLVQILSKYPALEQILEVWPSLSDEIKQQIIDLI